MPISLVDPQLTATNVNQNATAQQLFPWQAAINAAAQRSNLFAPHVPQQPVSIVPNNFNAAQLELGLHDQMARYVRQPHGQSFFDGGIDVASVASGSNNAAANHYALNPIALFMASSNPSYIAPNNGLTNAAFTARRQPANHNQKPVYAPPANQLQLNRASAVNGPEENSMSSSVSSMQLRSSTENEQHQINMAQAQQQLAGVFVPPEQMVGMLMQQQPYF